MSYMNMKEKSIEEKFKECDNAPDPSLCRDLILAKAIEERTVSNTVLNILKTNIDSITEQTTAIREFKENILPSMNNFNNNFTEFMGQKEVKINSIEGAVKGIAYDMDTMKTDINGMKTDINGMKTDINGMKTDINGMKTDINGMKTLTG